MYFSLKFAKFERQWSSPVSHFVVTERLLHTKQKNTLLLYAFLKEAV